MDNLKERVASLEAQLAAYEAKSGYLSAEEMLKRTNAWIARNPRAWRYLKARGREAIRNRARFSIKKECELLRESNLIKSPDDYRVSNSYSAVLVRLLIIELPKLYTLDLVSVKKSKVDGILKWKPTR